MFVFRKARNPTKTLNDLDAYLNSQSTEPIKWLAREVQSWNEFSYAELEAAILDGRLEDIIDWQARYAAAINAALAPQWSAAIEAASKKASRGKVILSDTNDWVKAWLTAHGAELATKLSDESKKAIANVLLKWQGELLRPREMAYQIRPLIGLNERQAIANANYRAKLYRSMIDNGVNPKVAAERADNAATRYASKQHRYRAETIVNTELAFAYNQGAHEGVTRSIAGNYMNHCEMVWTTAGTNRVCSRCLELKDTVVGRTDESGVTLPPLHPRCRCAIMYRELKDVKPANGRNYNNELAKTIGKDHYDAMRNIIENSPHAKARAVWNKFEDKIKVEVIPKGEKAYHCGGKIFINLFEHLTGRSNKLPYQTVAHETAHLIDYLLNNSHFSVEYKNQAFAKAIISDLEALIDTEISKIFKPPKKPMARIRSLFSQKEWAILKVEGYITSDEWIQLAKMATRPEAKKRILEKFAMMTDEEIIAMLRENVRETAIQNFCNEMKSGYSLFERSSLSDIFSGYSTLEFGKQVTFGSAHEMDYWRNHRWYAVAWESFAHFMESALANQGDWAVLNKFLPTASKVFEEMLDEILK